MLKISEDTTKEPFVSLIKRLAGSKWKIGFWYR